MRIVLFLAFVVLAAPVAANEAQIRKVLEPKLGGAKIEGIQPSPIAGLWEVRVRTERGWRILYTDANAAHVIDGNILEVRANEWRDLTEERLQKLNAIKFEQLPLHQAVKIQRGDGRRVLAMFSDPYCPYCVKFEKVLQQVNNITVYVFMYPVIRPQNADHSKAVWCSPDRAKAWLDLALNHKPPAAAPTCDNPVEKNVEFGRSINVNGTPTLFLSNGERISAGLSAADLSSALDQAAKGEKKR